MFLQAQQLTQKNKKEKPTTSRLAPFFTPEPAPRIPTPEFIPEPTPEFIPEPISKPTPEPTPIAIPVDRQAEIQRIREEIAKIKPGLKKLQEQIGILKEAEEKGFEITPKKTVEEAQKFLTAWKPPTIDEVDEFKAQEEIITIPTDIKGRMKFMAQEVADIREEIKTKKEEQKTFWEKMETMITTPFRREVKMRELEEERKIKELQTQREATLTRLTTLQEEADKVKAEQKEALAASEARLAPMAFIRGEQARINERYQRQLAGLSAEMARTMALHQAQTGEIKEAYRWVDKMVEAATWDKQLEWQRLVTMNKLYEDEIDDLGREFKDWFGGMTTLARLTYEEEKETKRQLMKWQIEYREANITLEDTLEEAVEKITALPALPDKARWEIREVDGTLVRVDPVTGKTERLYEAPKKLTALEKEAEGLRSLSRRLEQDKKDFKAKDMIHNIPLIREQLEKYVNTYPELTRDQILSKMRAVGWKVDNLKEKEALELLTFDLMDDKKDFSDKHRKNPTEVQKRLAEYIDAYPELARWQILDKMAAAGWNVAFLRVPTF